MLKIIEGSFYSDAGISLKNRIKASLLAGKKAVLIVPEQQTVIAESEMARMLSDDAPMLFEVTNFTRLANSIFRTLGGVDKEYCDSAKKALVMWRALTELSPTLSFCDGHREVNYGMVKRALAAAGEADSLTISNEDLNGVKAKISDNTRLLKKVEDLVLITSLYKRLLSEKYADVGEDIAEAARKLSEHPEEFCDTEFFIDGFTSFTEPQYSLIELLIERTDLNVHLSLSRARADAFEFLEPQDTKKRLTALAAKKNSTVSLDRRDGRFFAKEELSAILDLLWQTRGKLDSDMRPEDAIAIYEAATPYDAADFIVSDVKRRAMLGASYSDFAIVCASAEKYVGILDVCAKRSGVPIFISASKDISSYEAVKLIYTALRCSVGGFMREDVISYAKCGLSGISRDECDKFELYTETWNITGKRFYDGLIWNMNPDGYSTRRAKDSDRRLIELNSVRELLISPLAALKDGLCEAETVRQYATALYRFMLDVSLSDAIERHAEDLTTIGEGELAEENLRIYKIICDALDTLVEASADEPTDAEGFISRLKIVFSSASVSKIPSFSDVVTVGSADMLRLSRKKYVYMLGVNKGELPSIAAPDSFFTERDRARLCREGLPFEENDDAKRARELYSFSRAFSYASDFLTLVYSTKSADFSSIKRADVIDRITDICTGRLNVKKISDIPARDLIYSPNDALESLGKIDEGDYEAIALALSDAGKERELKIAEGKPENDSMRLSADTLDIIYRDDIYLSQSKIDCYNTCPLSYFCRYDLKLSEGEAAEFDARNIGSFVHAILENFFALSEELDTPFESIDEETRDALIKKAAEAYLEKIITDGEVKTKRTSLLIDRLVHACKPIVLGLCEEFSGSDYRPKYFELAIGGKQEHDPELLTFTDGDGKRTLIKGSIDRVDTFKYGNDVYVRVIDYKTGKKDFSPADLFEGKNLQMFLYLRAVVDSKNKKLYENIGLGEDGRLIPAGVLYVKSDLSDVKISHASPETELEAVKSEQRRQGMLLDDPISLGAMNLKFLPIRIKKDGSYYKDSEKKLYSSAGWESLCKTVEDSVKKVTGKMRSGNIYAEPMKKKNSSPCEYCKFKPICRNAKIK